MQSEGEYQSYFDAEGGDMAEEETKEVHEVKYPPIVRDPEGTRSLVEIAIEKGASVEVLEKLLTLQERWEANQAKKAFNLAVARVRPKLPPLIKNQEVDYTSAKGRTQYKHEDLAEALEALAPVLAEEGLSVRYRTKNDARTVTVTLIFSHAMGHSEESELTCGHDHSGGKNEIQAIGSAVSYLQRYTLKPALGIAAARDDDARAAGENLRRTLTPGDLHDAGSAATYQQAKDLQKAPPSEQKGPSTAGMKPLRVLLFEDILTFCNGNRERATGILKEITGKASASSLSETEAMNGRTRFREQYLDKAQFSQAPAQDDLPNFKPPTESQ